MLSACLFCLACILWCVCFGLFWLFDRSPLLLTNRWKISVIEMIKHYYFGTRFLTQVILLCIRRLLILWDQINLYYTTVLLFCQRHNTLSLLLWEKLWESTALTSTTMEFSRHSVTNNETHSVKWLSPDFKLSDDGKAKLCTKVYLSR